MKTFIACGLIAGVIAVATGNTVSVGGIWISILLISLTIRAARGLSTPDIADEHRRRSF